MPRSHSRFVCQACGEVAAGWLGRCPGCGAYQSMVEERTEPPPAAGRGRRRPGAAPATGASAPEILRLAAVTGAGEARLATGWDELDRVLGGGLVQGSLCLIGGDPGVGKSTLLLQTADAIARRWGPVLYVSGEESVGQLRLRGERLGTLAEDLYVLAEASLDAMEARVDAVPWRLLVVDSIQTAYCEDLPSPPGSVAQVRECAGRLLGVAKTRGLATIVVGHVTKADALAGPATLFHLVDAVFTFEGDRHQAYRLLRATKNRYGATDEVGVFEMGGDGLRAVPNLSARLLAQRHAARDGEPGVAGSVVAAAVEGSRPLFVEVQALVAPSAFGVPRRVAEGFDTNRLALVCAVLERRAGLGLNGRDIYLKVAAGVRLEEPGADLAVALAVASAALDRPVPPDLAVAGEVGLAGELRSVARVGERRAEAARLGLARLILPWAGGSGDGSGGRPGGIPAPAGEVLAVRTIQEAMAAALDASGGRAPAEGGKDEIARGPAR